MLVKKFKNGNINMRLEKSDLFYYGYHTQDVEAVQQININIDKLYDNEITQNDLYFNQINGYTYLVDFNTSRVYGYSKGYFNALLELKNDLLTFKTIKLYPYGKKYSESLIEDLNNGY